MIRVEHVSAAELRQGDLRFEGGYYCSDGAQARRFLARSGIPTATLKELCVPGGIFIPHRFKRPYVRDSGSGIPYVTGSSVGLADPRQGCAYLSRNPRLIPHKAQLMLGTGLILVTSSGETGNAIYTGNLFDGVIGSPDLLRLVANNDVVRPGYLYAFLASPLGKGLLTQGTYGGVVPHIEASHVFDVPVPRLDEGMEQTIHALVEQAVQKRVDANRRLCKAQDLVYESTGLLPREGAPVGRNVRGARTYVIEQSRLEDRLEARFHDVLVCEMRRDIEGLDNWSRLADVTTGIYEEHRHKLRDAAENGLPFVGSGEMFAAYPRPHRWLSRLIPGIEALSVKQGTILVAKSGQIYSILGDVVLVGRTLARMAVSWHALRIMPDPTQLHPGFLFAFLSLPDYGYGQIVSTAYGTSIPEISTEHVKQIRVPMPDETERNKIGEDVLRAIALRDDANDLEDQAQQLLSVALSRASRESNR